MSSRILQQDSSLLLTQASEPLVNENFIATNSISTGSPSVSSVGLSQVYNLTPSSISTGSPSVSSASLSQAHSLSPNSTSTGSPSVSPVGLSQGHSLTVTAIVSGQVVVPAVGITQDYPLQANNVSSPAPSVPALTLVEGENFAVVSVSTEAPELGDATVTQVYNLSPSDITNRRPVVDDASDPNAIIAQEIKEIEQMFGGWPRRAYEVPDGRLVQAEREIEATYGDRVSVDRKAKSLLKFGKSAELGTSGLETVWTLGGNETYVSSNDISHISSSSGDTQEIYVEGHTVDDGEFTFVTQTATLSGNTKVSLDTPLARVSRVSNNGSTEVVGRVVVYEDTTVSGGVPTDETKIHIDMVDGHQQSFKAATTLSKEDYYVMTGFYGAVSAKKSAAADFYIEIRNPNGVFLPKACFTASSTGGNSDISLDPAIIVPKNSDIRVRCDTETNQAVVFGIFKGYLAKVM